MLNAVWILIIIGSVLCGAFSGTLSEVSFASTESAKSAVMLVLGLIGVMAFWLGLMQVLQQGGLLITFARLVRPITTRLFPDIPPEHPATSMMMMNIVANMLGLGNAATPFGLKAMTELQKLNPHPDTASNSMALFLAINTSNLALLPTGIIALRTSMGSTHPGSIILPSILATTFSTCVAILAAKLLQRLAWFRISKIPPSPRQLDTDGTNSATFDTNHIQELFSKQSRSVPSRTKFIGWMLAALTISALVYAFIMQVYSPDPGGNPAGFSHAVQTAMTQWPLAILIVMFVLFGVIRGVKVFDVIAEGGREALQFSARFAVYFVVMMVGIGMLRASGAIDLMVQALQPITQVFGMPAETLPMAIMRPLSGKGAYGVVAEIMKYYGPDTIIGQIVSTMQGSTETTFYVLALYFGVVKIRVTRHTIPACLIADLAGILGAVWACRLILS